MYSEYYTIRYTRRGKNVSPLLGKSFLAYFSVDFRILFFKVRKKSRAKFDVFIKNLSDDFLTIFYWKKFSWCYFWVRTGKSKQSTVPSIAHQTKSFRLPTTNFLVVNVHTCRRPQKKNQGRSTYRKETASIETGSRFSAVGVLYNSVLYNSVHCTYSISIYVLYLVGEEGREVG